MTADGKKQIPFKEGLYKLPHDGEKGCLIGSRCRNCGKYFHPKRMVCLNCYSEELEEVPLSNQGKISTYTIARIGYPGTPMASRAPFVTGLVQLPEKVQVISLITDVDVSNVKIGTDVNLYFWKTGEDPDGREIMAYAFRPLSAERKSGR